LVSLDENATNTAILAVGTSTGAGYAFHKGRDFAYLLKWSSSFAMSVLWCERPAVPLPHSNVVLTLSLTRLTTNYVITTRVLDKADPRIVLFQHSTVDTPGRDSTLTTAQFQALTGIPFLDLVPDAVEPPPASVGAVLGVFQNTHGHEPVPTAVWDNLELQTYEVPAVAIQPAMRLTWLAPADLNYAVEGAPTPQGPWQPLSVPVTDSEIPGMKQASVPANQSAQFFRLVQAP
jgi:hypothetical protein